MASRSSAYMMARRTRTSASTGLRLFSHMKEWGPKNSQPLVVTSTLGSAFRRSMSKYSTVPPGSTSSLPDSKAAEREAASGITWKYRVSTLGTAGSWYCSLRTSWMNEPRRHSLNL
ncbi:hypothetical protein D9M68_698650 [compost metagenome]